MDARTYWRIILLAFVLVIFMLATSYANAVKLVDRQMDWGSGNIALLFHLDDGSTYCLGLVYQRVVDYLNSDQVLKSDMTDEEFKALTQNNAPLPAELEATCAALRLANPLQWVVKQYRTSPDRPVKRIVDVDGTPTVDTSDTIGRIAHGEPCGNEIFSGTSYMWREVTITYPDGSLITGAAVCTQ